MKLETGCSELILDEIPLLVVAIPARLVDQRNSSQDVCYQNRVVQGFCQSLKCLFKWCARKKTGSFFDYCCFATQAARFLKTRALRVCSSLDAEAFTSESRSARLGFHKIEACCILANYQADSQCPVSSECWIVTPTHEVPSLVASYACCSS